MGMSDSERAEKAVKYIVETYEAPRQDWDAADAKMAHARVEIGKYLFQEFFKTKQKV